MDQASFDKAALGLARDRGHVTVALLAERLPLDAAQAKRRLQALYDSGALELDLEGEDLVYRLKGEARAAAAPQARAESAAAASADDAGELAGRGGRLSTKAGREPSKDTAAGAREDAVRREGVARRKEAAGKSEDSGNSDSGNSDSGNSDSGNSDDAGEPDDDASIGDGIKEATAAMVSRGRTAIATAAVGALLEDAGAKEVAKEDKKSMLWGVGLGLFLPGLGLFYSAPIVTATLCSIVVLATLGLLQLIPVLGTLLSYFLFGFFMLASGALGGAYTYYFNKTGRRTRLRKTGKGLKALPF